MSTARNIALAIVAVTALSIAGVMAWRVLRHRVAHIDVSRAVYPVKGIDISSHNGGDIDFFAVAADTVEFVYIKASEGENFRDSLFYHNYAGVCRANMKVGAYHFFRFDREGWRQGRNLLETVRNLRLDLPLAIDVEEWRNASMFDADDVVRQLRDMIDYLHEYRRDVIIYTNRDGYNRFIRFRFDDIPVWISAFSKRPLDASWHLWQHSHRGRVNGIRGFTDLNTFNGSREEWNRWLEGYYQP
ncbi:MAG: hypothetical protein K2O12_07295 [Muribaculaceae bacterium]|nr:hypothetical protein [Muribaculaceae bacterium]